MRRTASRRSFELVTGMVLAASASVLLAAGPAGAATVSDEAQLRAAFANPAETIIDLTANVDLADCAAGQLLRPDAAALTINGGGYTIKQTCPGHRVMANGSGSLTIDNTTITGGSLDAGVLGGAGGGILSAGALTIEDSTVTANRADGELGGKGGGVAAAGLLTITRSTISNNIAGGGRSIFGGQGGGVSGGSGGVSIVESTLDGNKSDGAAEGGGQAPALISDSSVTIARSTLSNNKAHAGTNSGSASMGAAAVNADFFLINSTVSGNAAEGPAGAYGGITASGKLVLVYDTIVGNSAATGAANVIFKPSDESFGSVIALPLGGAANCSAPVGSSHGRNFSDDNSCGLTGAGDRQSAGNPQLGALGDNGGPTRTHLPLTGSPLVDGIPTANCHDDGAANITTDQRNQPRPSGNGCDVGSVEGSGTSPTTTQPPPPTSTTQSPTTPTTVNPSNPSTTGRGGNQNNAANAAGNSNAAAGNTGSGTTSGGLPLTGAAILTLVLIALALIVTGVLLRQAKQRRELGGGEG